MRTSRILFLRKCFLIRVVLSGGMLCADNAVEVTIEAAETSLRVGQSTTVTIYGQIDAAIASDSDQIFSWYIDILNDDGEVAGGYANLATPTSDNNPLTSGDGTVMGADLRGIYDTFLDHPGAGKGSRVVLVQFEVTARSVGTATFSVAAGTTAGSLSDFLVSKTGGGSYSGGIYAGASVAISVSRPDLRLDVSRTADQADITFNPISLPGFTHTIQFSDTLQPPSWIDLPGGPHNSGIASQVVAGHVRRFYRVAVNPPP